MNILARKSAILGQSAAALRFTTLSLNSILCKTFSVVAETKNLTIGVPKEIFPGEKRVAISPDAAQKMVKLGFKVVVEKGAGEEARLPDARYEEAGCKILSTEEVF
jgi:hypothetical protein